MKQIIERKGNGHPDTIADNLAETLAKKLKIEYVKQYGKIQHYNVDKVLCSCGKIDYDKKVMIDPVKIVFSGNATKVNTIDSALHDTVKEVLKHEIARGMKYEIFNHIAEGSPDLIDNFDVHKCNDTSFAVGFQLNSVEKLVLAIGKFLESLQIKSYIGTDYKIMYVNGDIFIAQAFICNDKEDYDKSKKLFKDLVDEEFGINVHVNTGDTDKFYFNTVTGTSLEQGDAGMVGRGNRRNGLITPMRPMTMEAYYGKNDITHNGRIYQDVAADIVKNYSKPIVIVNNIGNDLDKYTVIEL